MRRKGHRWSVDDVDDACAYVLHLCEDSEGDRFFKLVPAERSNERSADALFVTQVVSNDLLQRRDFEAIANAVPLSDGARFHVDAHGIWLSASEAKALSAGGSLTLVPWVTGKMPKFPPK